MSFYIGVLFFCLQDQGCYFLKINNTFDKIETCQKEIREWDQYARKEGLKTEMACLEVTPKTNV